MFICFIGPNELEFIFVLISLINFLGIILAESLLGGSLVTMEWCDLRLQMKETVSRCGG
jgi:hypothetical protein